MLLWYDSCMEQLLDPIVLKTLQQFGLEFTAMECNPDLADTTAFCEHYGFTLQESANTIVVMSRKIEPVQYAACVVLADSRLDVNKAVCQQMGIKRASFADGETTKQLTNMMIGGVTAVGVTTMPIYVDARVMQQQRVVMGGGNRSSKITLNPQELLKLPNVQVVANLAHVKPAV
jgi:prolyl-tRNA editing enzyme YbaK/EbsC (Cys-tRNA(Pro) deacylase)